jgi:hypothetical protein
LEFRADVAARDRGQRDRRTAKCGVPDYVELPRVVVADLDEEVMADAA